MNVDHLPWTQ